MSAVPKKLPDSFKRWLAESLSKLGIGDDDVYISYIESILCDQADEEEKKDSILGFLSAAVDQDLSSFWDELSNKWEAALKEIKPQNDQTKNEKKPTLDDYLSVKVEDLRIGTKSNSSNPESKAEKKQREQLLAKYGYDVEETDENGDIILSGGNTKSPADSGLAANVNASMVAQADRVKREKAKEQHQQKVQRDKENEEKQRLKKEKAKQKTQKRERQGRRG